MRFGTKTTPWFPCQANGCFYRLEDGVLLQTPMLADGTMATEAEGGEVMFEAFDGADLAFLITIGRALENPTMFEGQEGDALPVQCPKCMVRFPDTCQCDR